MDDGLDAHQEMLRDNGFTFPQYYYSRDDNDNDNNDVEIIHPVPNIHRQTQTQTQTQSYTKIIRPVRKIHPSFVYYWNVCWKEGKGILFMLPYEIIEKIVLDSYVNSDYAFKEDLCSYCNNILSLPAGFSGRLSHDTYSVCLTCLQDRNLEFDITGSLFKIHISLIDKLDERYGPITCPKKCKWTGTRRELYDSRHLTDECLNTRRFSCDKCDPGGFAKRTFNGLSSHRQYICCTRCIDCPKLGRMTALDLEKHHQTYKCQQCPQCKEYTTFNNRIHHRTIECKFRFSCPVCRKDCLDIETLKHHREDFTNWCFLQECLRCAFTGNTIDMKFHKCRCLKCNKSSSLCECLCCRHCQKFFNEDIIAPSKHECIIWVQKYKRHCPDCKQKIPEEQELNHYEYCEKYRCQKCLKMMDRFVAINHNCSIKCPECDFTGTQVDVNYHRLSHQSISSENETPTTVEEPIDTESQEISEIERDLKNHRCKMCHRKFTEQGLKAHRKHCKSSKRR